MPYWDSKTPLCCLSLHLQGKTKFVALLVDLGPDAGIGSKRVLGANCEAVSSRAASSEGDASLKGGRVLQVDSSSELLGVVGGAMDDHVTGVVGQSKVVFGEGGLACIEGGLVAKSISTMSNRCGDVHKGRA